MAVRVPIITPLAQGSAPGGGRPGIYVLNFDPTKAAFAGLCDQIESGSLLIVAGDIDPVTCAPSCVTGLAMVGCRAACDSPTTFRVITSITPLLAPPEAPSEESHPDRALPKAEPRDTAREREREREKQHAREPAREPSVEQAIKAESKPAPKK